jgi:hypothetical protein
MQSVSQLNRELMLSANNYKATYGINATIRHLYVTPDYYKFMRQHAGGDFSALGGYSIFLVNDDRHPDYVICLR